MKYQADEIQRLALTFVHQTELEFKQWLNFDSIVDKKVD